MTKRKELEVLKACPFCEESMSYTEFGYARCRMCGAAGPHGRPNGTDDDIARTTNTRPIEAALQAKVNDAEMEEQVALVYDHITHGRISKTNTMAHEVIAASDDLITEQVELEKEQCDFERHKFERARDDIKELREKVFEFAEADGLKNRALRKIDPITIKHGSCCCCTTCGEFHDDCVCSHNSLCDELKALLDRTGGGDDGKS